MNLPARLVKEKANDLGFDLVGITTPETSRNYPAYEAWLAAGYHGDMTYLENDRGRAARANVNLLLPACRAVVSLGWQYPAMLVDGGRVCSSSVPQGLIASYAWGIDYHISLMEKMEELCEFLVQNHARPLQVRAYTDSGPILERDYAQRAGLGWVGKNTNLIAPRRGSFFLLAEILLDCDLEPNVEFTKDHCGNCRRCLDACPTQCLLPGRVMDARRCISYLTIEFKGILPRELRPAMQNWIFGCDVCQQVCPWNERFAQPQIPYPTVDLIDEMALTPQQFKHNYRSTPVLRARRRGYLRNVAVALGNSGNPLAITALSHALESDTEPLVRGHAAWALGCFHDEQATRVLNHALPRESDLYVRDEIQHALEDRR